MSFGSDMATDLDPLDMYVNHEGVGASVGRGVRGR